MRESEIEVGSMPLCTLCENMRGGWYRETREETGKGGKEASTIIV